MTQQGREGRGRGQGPEIPSMSCLQLNNTLHVPLIQAAFSFEHDLGTLILQMCKACTPCIAPGSTLSSRLGSAAR